MKKSIKNPLSTLLMSRTFFAVITGAFFLLYPALSEAQNNWQLNIRGAANFPTSELGNTNLNTGLGFEGNIGYQFIPQLTAYVGWGWNRFTSDQSFLGSNVDFEETGYNLGLQFNYPIGNSKLDFVIGGAGIYNHIEAENTSGEVIEDTGHGLGWQVDAGISLPISGRLKLIPGVRYRALSRKFIVGNVTTPVDLNYLSAGAGLTWSF